MTKTKKRTRDTMISLRIEKDVARRIGEAAKNAGVSRSEFIRSTVLEAVKRGVAQ